MEYDLHTHTLTGQGGIGGKDARIMQLGEREGTLTKKLTEWLAMLSEEQQFSSSLLVETLSHTHTQSHVGI